MVVGLNVKNTGAFVIKLLQRSVVKQTVLRGLSVNRPVANFLYYVPKTVKIY